MAAATPAAPAAAAMVLASMAAALGLGCLRGVAGGEGFIRSSRSRGPLEAFLCRLNPGSTWHHPVLNKLLTSLTLGLAKGES